MLEASTTRLSSRLLTSSIWLFAAALLLLSQGCTPPSKSEPTQEKTVSDAATDREPVREDDPFVPEDPVVTDEDIPKHSCETPTQVQSPPPPPTLLRTWQGHGPTSFYPGTWSMFALNRDQTLIAVAYQDSRYARLLDAKTGKTLRVLSGQHTQGVYALAFSPDGKTLAVGGYDDIITLWKVPSGEYLRTLKGQNGDMRAVAFSPDGKLLASASTDDRIGIWEVATGKRLHLMVGHKSDTQSVVFLPSGKHVISGSSDGVMRIWDVATGKQTGTFGSKLGSVQRLALSSDGKQLLTGSTSDDVRLWNVSNLSKVTQVFQTKLNGDIVGVGFLPNGREVFAVTHRDRDSVSILNRRDGKKSSGFHKLYNPTDAFLSRDGKSLWQLQRGIGTLVKTELSSKNNLLTITIHERRESDVAVYNEGKSLATLNQRGRELSIRDAKSGVMVRRLKAPTGVVWTALAARYKDTRLWAAVENGVIEVWGLNSNKRLTQWKGHTAPVWKMVFNHDESILASASSDGTIRLWDTTTGKTLHTLTKHKDAVSDIAFSKDGKYLVSGSFDTTVKIWEVRSGALQKSLEEHKTQVWSVAFAPDGKTVASGERDKNILVWNWTKDTKPVLLNKHSSVVSALLFDDNGTLISGSFDKTIRRWDVKKTQVIATIGVQFSNVRHLRWSRDRKTLLSMSTAETLHRWELTSPTPLKKVTTLQGELKAFAVNSQRTMIATGDDKGQIRLLSMPEGNVVKTLKGTEEEILHLAFSPDGKWLASSGSQDKNAVLWEVSTGKVKFKFDGHKDKVYSIAFSPDGKKLATASGDWSYKLWDLSNGKELHSVKGHTAMVNAVAFSNDGKLLATGSYDRQIHVWDVATAKRSYTLSGHIGGINGLAFSKNGASLYSSSFDTYVREWRLSDKRHIRTYGGHAQGLTVMHISPSGRYMLTSSFDNKIGLWNLRSGRLIRFYTTAKAPAQGFVFGTNEETFYAATEDKQLQQWALRSPLVTFASSYFAIRSMMYSPDGKTLFTSADDTYTRYWEDDKTSSTKYIRSYPYAKITSLLYQTDGDKVIVGQGNGWIARYNVQDRRHIGTLKGHRGSVLSMNFSKDGQWLLTGSADKEVRIWDTKEFSVFDVLRGHTGAVTGVLLSDDGSTVVSASTDRSLRLWDINNGALKDTLKGYTSAISSLHQHPSEPSQVVTTALDGTLKSWDVSTGKLKRNLCFKTALTNLAIAPTTKRVALLQSNGTILLLDDKWRIQQTLKPGTFAFHAVTWSPDESRLVAGNARGGIVVWEWNKK